jgi:hypothetical protein
MVGLGDSVGWARGNNFDMTAGLAFILNYTVNYTLYPAV